MIYLGTMTHVWRRAGFIAPLLVLSLSTAVLMPTASADPIPLLEPSLDEPTGIGMTFLTNLPVNALLLMVLIFAVVTVRGRGSSDFSDNKWKFGRDILLAVLVISLLGAFTDFALLYGTSARIEQDVIPSYSPEMDPVKWSVAGALILSSVFAASYLFLRIDILRGLVVAAGMALLNVVWWLAITGSDTLVQTSVVICAVLCGPTALMLGRWHASEYAEPTEPSVSS